MELCIKNNREVINSTDETELKHKSLDTKEVLVKLSEIFEQGLITKEEFQRQKKNIIMNAYYTSV